VRVCACARHLSELLRCFPGKRALVCKIKVAESARREEEKKRRSERNAEAEQRKRCSMATPPPPPLEAGSGETDDVDGAVLIGTGALVVFGSVACLIALVCVSVGKTGEEWSKLHLALIRGLGWMLLGVLPFAYLLWLSHFGNRGILSWSQSQRQDILYGVYVGIAIVPCLPFIALAMCLVLAAFSDGQMGGGWDFGGGGGSDKKATKKDDEKGVVAKSASNNASAAPLLPAMTMPARLPESLPGSPPRSP